MSIYKTRWFVRWARKQGLTTPNLCAAVGEMSEGLYDADLGGGLFKKRIARAGQGKSGGFLTLVATNKGNRWIFVFGFPKNERSNIDKDEVEALKKLAAHLLSFTPQAIGKAQRAGGVDGGRLRCARRSHPSLMPSTRRPRGCTRPA